MGGTREFDFDPSGTFLFAANNTTSEVVTFASDRATGRLTPTGATAPVARPAVIKFVML
jgi:6-phosphogluconolactonase